MNFFDVLFYKYYQFAILLGNEDFYPEVNAWFLATLMPWLNIMSLNILLKNYNYVPFTVFKTLIILSSVLWIISIFYTFKNKKYLKIIEEMEKPSGKNPKTIFTIIYSILTIVIYGILSN